MPYPSKDQLAELRQRRDEVQAEAKRLLQNVQRSGRDELVPIEQATFKNLMAQVRNFNVRIREMKDDLDRSYDGRIGSGKSHRAGRPGTAGQLSPLNFGHEELRTLHQKVLRQEPGRLEQRLTFSTADGALPAQLFPTPTFPIHERRLLNWLPGFEINAPSLEYIQVNSVTGIASVTAEGAAKPEIVLNTTNVITPVLKIAAHLGLSWESINDFDAFTSSANVELVKQIVDEENDQILNGPGNTTTSDNLTGLLQTSGILTYAHNTGTTPTETPLDAFEIAIAEMRVGSALAEPDLIVINPTTWSSVRRTKDLYGRYQITNDPSIDEPETIWGIQVLTTTTCPAGTACLIDTQKMGRVAIREPIGVRVGYSGNDFTNNILRWVAEERLALCVERPAAILKLTNLPTS